MGFLVIMLSCYAIAIVPIVAALACKAKKVGAVVSTLLSVAMLASVGAVYRVLFGVGEGKVGVPVLISAVLIVLSISIGAYLFRTADERF